MVSRRLQLHPAEALAGHIDPETPVVPSQSLRSPLSVEAIQVSSAAKDTKQKHKKHKEVEMQREKAEDESVSEMHKSIWIACNPSIREAEARGLLQSEVILGCIATPRETEHGIRSQHSAPYSLEAGKAG